MSEIINRSVNKSPKSENLVKNSKYIAPTRSLSKKKAELQPGDQIQEEEEITSFNLSPSASVTHSNYRDSGLEGNSSRRMRENRLFQHSSSLFCNRKNTILNVGGALISSLFLYFMLCLFLKVIGHWEGNVENIVQPLFGLGRYGNRELTALSIATPSRIYCRLNSASQLDSLFSVRA